jgi:solute carrier family 15 oligopeptide transporter 1
MFLPIPVFWALYEQQSSRWVFQAERMNRKIGSVEIKPDQMIIINVIFILIFLPVCEKWIYPRMTSVKQLQRMAIGMLFAALAFVAAGLLELAISKAGVGEVGILWQIPQCVFLRPPSIPLLKAK